MIYLLLFFEFFKIGLFTFGGGFAMIPLVEEVVLKHGWLTEDAFYNFIGVCESTPGPIAINMATYVGSEQGGLLGSVLATLGVVLPSFIIIIIIASVLKRFTDNKYFKAFIKGVKPVVTALILSVGIILLAKTLGYTGIETFSLDLPKVLVFALVCGVYFGAKYIFKKKLSAIAMIIISAGIGLLVYVPIDIWGI